MSAEVRRSRLAANIVARGVFGLAALDALLFSVAGRTDWRAPWLLTGLFAGFFGAGGAWLLQHDADLLTERLTTAANVPRWDRVIRRVYDLLMLTLLVTAALDAGRFRWSTVPLTLQMIGAAAVASAFAAIWWCTAVNHFLSADARLQRERGQTVVQNGPYRFVRHPMYTSLIVMMMGIALLLGSWLAVVPAVLIGVLFVIRTSLEDRMLTDGLAGYRDYAERVPARLLPGVW